MFNNLKFRIWDKYKKIWLDPSKVAIAGNGTMIAYDQYPDDKNSPQKEWTPQYIKERLILTLWTGLKDNHGKLIYGGDIVEWEDYDEGWGHDNDPIEKGKGTVVWGHNAYAGYTHGWTIRELSNMNSEGIEKKQIKVVGNIFERTQK